MRTYHQRWIAWAASIALLLAAIAILLTQQPVASAGSDPARPGNRARATPTAPRATVDPFPATTSMTDTVMAVVQEYEQRRANRTLADAWPVKIAAQESRLFLPHIRTHYIVVVPPTPTATMTSEPPTPTATNIPPTVTPTSTTPPPTWTPEPAPVPADVATTLWPSPSIRVARNGTLAYEIRVKNYGEGEAGGNSVRLPYNKQQMTVVDSRFNKPGDWVSELADDHVTVTFGRISPGEYRTATIIFRVNGWLPDNTVIHMRATAAWSDGAGGGSTRTNWAPILVSPANASAGWVWTEVDPLGGWPGTNHRFFSDRFIPGEGIVTWINTPGGVKPLDLRGTADRDGRVTLDFRSSGLPAGTYSLVLYGARSNLTGVATFYVW
jgi:hypothetical protein